MLTVAWIAATPGSPITPAATAIAPSASTGLACRPRSRSAAGRLLPPGLHATGQDRTHRLPEQGSGLRPAVPRRSPDTDDDCSGPQAPRRSHWRHRRPPYLGLGDDPSSAYPHDRARRRDIARRYTLGALQSQLSPASARALPPIPAALPDAARRRLRGGPADVLWRDRGPGSPRGLHRAPCATQEEEVVRLRQAALCRTRGGARLSRPLHPPRRHLEQPAGQPRRARRNFPLQGLPPRRPGAVSHDDA